ncbi:MAG: alpha-amylase family glycosyl hydrolase [bacterium]|nr:alpha-amylase family glycosyl hydrolase [bacterium]
MAARDQRRVGYFPLEFQISRNRWEAYELDRCVVPPEGVARTPDFKILRRLVQRIHERAEATALPRPPLQAGQLNATGLINEIFRSIVRLYLETVRAAALREGLAAAAAAVTPGRLEAALGTFVRLFPPLEVLRSATTEADYLEGKTGRVPHREVVAAEILLLSLANANPAFSPAAELFGDAPVAEASAYREVVAALEAFFRRQPGLRPGDPPLVDFLMTPIIAGGASLQAQLAFIKDNWRDLLPEALFYRLLTALDLLREEEKTGGPGQGPSLVLKFKDLEGYPDWARCAEYPEEERFTEDREWMGDVVLLAKSTYVWLDQLSRKHGRAIRRLDEIPDEELDTIARWGFTGLWLIGVWERSPASRRIKEICGNREALASAYSVFDYEIARELGGEEGFRDLKGRAEARGIRLATDVVPNHMGIYSRWVVERPERFIALDAPPYPGYRFTGPDLSEDPRVSIRIEDGYWTRRDAAVVFERRDRRTGETRYIYHGNDGTSMPWNDTAQLDFLREDVREAVTRLILGVARHFRIIRLDAAMTIAKRHFQRLWYPHPGTGGGIPSRAEHGMRREEFDRLMPREFWREVVDRVNREMPDTLLLAEAFWLMEGYFVRTLGMHRVYNSAFMNMLKTEENDKYRQVIKNVLEFDPRILRRFVNFMNNPDEQTAVAQFGTGDKYFGVCLMLVTMPGLPMFGHGQIEGLREKYGMEYHRAYWDETPDWGMVKRHEAEIFPLMRRRRLFSDVGEFLLYDFYTPDGRVNENVFAYSNRHGDERALIVYQNKYEETEGWIRTSCAFAVDPGDPRRRRLVQRTLAEGLRISDDPSRSYIFRDLKTGLEYLRTGRELARKGLHLRLAAFQYRIFTDFREVRDGPAGHYRRLARHLGERGVPSVEEALREFILAPVHAPLRRLAGREMTEAILSSPLRGRAAFREGAAEFLAAVRRSCGARGDDRPLLRRIMRGLGGALKLRDYARPDEPGAALLAAGMAAESGFWGIVAAWLLARDLGRLRSDEEAAEESAAMADELLLGKAAAAALREYVGDDWNAAQAAALVRILVRHAGWYDGRSDEERVAGVRGMLADCDVRSFIGVNAYNGTLWFNRERMERLLFWLLAVSAVALLSEGKGAAAVRRGMEERRSLVTRLLDAAGESGWAVERFLSLLG